MFPKWGHRSATSVILLARKYTPENILANCVAKSANLDFSIVPVIGGNDAKETQIKSKLSSVFTRD